ncbi:nicotinate-nucleotide adenylyltransferase [Sediminicurvatus halobius]|uniref:Probable nicotinate-nucleotide adenylyltransferase n=1 Tax=Sediminicurvatus halobius TaxID=2182432 RepID=A0A2U2N8D9_9GAMM|nr:nicotinate-nucleotide adenylyltransferase [Spiribacter halobius]PWG64103.1 nicotinic acid mononucleotide adenylyltransferase [Spiribacter halobius]PWG65264.1 nicotinic acid mononucleotide adenylyltransferase [Spiribacter halobius]UEX78780.1 nicotinate-nucleotide adenylyltransferase [Spiribacter halobius]
MTVAVRRAPVAVLGGTFDPVHYGHLRPAIELLEGLGLAEVRLVPGRVPPHRATPSRPPALRRALVAAAVDGVPGLVVDDRELQRPGPSYTLDTLRSLRQELGPERPLCFALGSDAFRGLAGWHRWRELIDYAHLVVMTRAGDRGVLPTALRDWLSDRETADPAALRTAPAGRVLFHPVARLEISATQIRRLLAHGRSARGLMPEAVWRRVAEEGLYGYPQP